uniref:p0648C09.12 protein n=1 Tax=Oryza sativa subsp. japonica TaxID=39947 RepID=Q8RYY8_ORYSJ|nr:P0648C09.12 [Oryza sativa Japonica Group]
MTSLTGRAFDRDDNGFIFATELARSMADTNTDLHVTSPTPAARRSHWPPFSLLLTASRRMPSGKKQEKTKRKRKLEI